MARIVRINSKTGRTRLEFTAGTTYETFIHRISEHFHLQESEVILSHDDAGHRPITAKGGDLLSAVLPTEMCVLFLQGNAQVPNTKV
jgi:predicted transcriptional regulator